MPPAEQVLTAAQMRAAEEALVAGGTSIEELMERAGGGAADWVWRVALGGPVTLLCGPGNNGGDGYVIARRLSERGLAVQVVAPMPPGTDAARAACARWNGPIRHRAELGRGGVLVDCLFGAGLTRPLSKSHAALLAELGRRHDVTIALDLPSGVATDDGAVLGEAPRCDLTLALGAWKPAHFLMPAMGLMGERRLVDIGIGAVAGAAEVNPVPRLSAPARGAHKYSRGLVGVVGGAMPGAALLAAEAAMRSGAGYVKLLADRSHPAAPAALVIDQRPLAEALDDPRWAALLVGPGLGRDTAARDRLAAVLDRRVPTVIDADALHLLDDDLLEGTDRSHLLVTPHAGELDALCAALGVPAGSKPARVAGLAQVAGLTVLAKGPDTMIAAPDGRVRYCPPASSWLSTAGTGDVLAGIAASRLAARGDPFAAASEASAIHARAAELAGPAFSANDLAAVVSNAYASFL